MRVYFFYLFKKSKTVRHGADGARGRIVMSTAVEVFTIRLLFLQKYIYILHWKLFFPMQNIYSYSYIWQVIEYLSGCVNTVIWGWPDAGDRPKNGNYVTMLVFSIFFHIFFIFFDVILTHFDSFLSKTGQVPDKILLKVFFYKYRRALRAPKIKKKSKMDLGGGGLRASLFCI